MAYAEAAARLRAPPRAQQTHTYPFALPDGQGPIYQQQKEMERRSKEEALLMGRTVPATGMMMGYGWPYPALVQQQQQQQQQQYLFMQQQLHTMMATGASQTHSHYPSYASGGTRHHPTK